MSIRMSIVAARYNITNLIELCIDMGSSMSFAKRWQFSITDGRGRYYDFYFVCKPTRKQIRRIIKQFRKEIAHV